MFKDLSIKREEGEGRIKMKKSVKKEKKKYPYNRFKHSIIAQMKAMERRKWGEVNRWAIVDRKNNIIEKYRLRWTADRELPFKEKQHFQELKVVELDEYGKVVVPRKK